MSYKDLRDDVLETAGKVAAKSKLLNKRKDSPEDRAQDGQPMNYAWESVDQEQLAAWLAENNLRDFYVETDWFDLPAEVKTAFKEAYDAGDFEE